MKIAYPVKSTVADMKTWDAGKHEAEQALNAGANIITVMAFSDNSTIIEALKAAKNHHKKVMIDLLGVKDSERVKEIYHLGGELFCLHIGKDIQK
jgi:3-hexulose-6-phosphate synthase